MPRGCGVPQRRPTPCPSSSTTNTSSWLALAPPLDDENLLQEIILCLPPQPSSLTRTSLVCKRWRNILSDPDFLIRFRKHHHKPPLLGFFTGITGSNFLPFLDTKPDRISAECFALRARHWNWYFMGCRHGLAVIINRPKHEAVVWDPLSGQQHHVTTYAILRIRPNIFLGNALFWLLCGGGVVEFDTERQSLGVIEKPVDAHGTYCFSFQLLRTDDSALGFAVLSKLSIQLWKRKSNCDGVVGWVLLQKIIQLEGLFPREMYSGLKVAKMVGYDEDSNVIVLATYIGNFMLQLESMRFRTISKRRNCWRMKIHYPYRNFYTAVRGDAGGDGAVNVNT